MGTASQTSADAQRAGPEVVAACAFSAVPGVGAVAMARIAAAFGGFASALDYGPAAILRRAGELELRAEARSWLARDPDLRDLGRWAFEAALAAGARVLLPADEEFPARLRAVANGPQVLYVRGSLVPEARRIAVVGSRESDESGLDLAREFGDALARAGVEVVSGGARGIDTAAHEGALWAQGRSIAVLGTGIDVAYPPENGSLFERLAGGAGAVLTELAPGAQPAPKNFPRRNRIVAGLSHAVVVVRASERSGALITAEHAEAQEVPLYAVPGDPRNRCAAGPNSLLREQKARAATGPLDLLRDLGWEVPAPLEAPDAPPRGGPASNRSERSVPDRTVVDAKGLRLWQLLDSSTPAHVDDLALRAQIPAREALGKLAELELKGMAVQRPGKYFLRR